MPRPARLRILTYNVHRCVGGDGVLAPARIAKVIALYQPDVVALQELDVGRARTRHGDQPGLIAGYLKMDHYFHPAFEFEDERYGDALLSRHPLHLVRAAPLPTLPHAAHLEQRGALWATVHWHGHAVQVLNTHLGLNRAERLAQVEALLGPAWLGDPACTAPRVLCGDLNAWPGTRAYGRLRRVLRDAQVRGAFTWPRYTYPARWPLLRLDHILHSPDVVVHHVTVPRTRLTRVASDHLPVLAEVSLS
jgi:endonuclease/exonuclease/phosphatase family metal-dependent hydrolase